MVTCLLGLSMNTIAQNVKKSIENKPIENVNINNLETVDYSTLKCYYLFSKKKESSDRPYSQDTMALEIGSKISRFYDPARLSRDSILSDRINNMKNITNDIRKMTILKEADAKDLSNMQGTVSSSSNDGESCQIFKDRLSNRVKLVDYSILGRDVFLYEEQIEPFQWKISNETETILSYSCQKATLHFRGRDYTAWFTQEIPVSDGPWKFMGLPGLIIKVEDNQHLFSFRLTGIQQIKNKIPIFYTGKVTIRCSRKDFEKLKMKQGPGKQYNFNGGDVIISDFPKKYDYTPMELE
ncbi:GLPGLI family protein [Pedobacter sp. L105]|uniref:GLPGLI family protein n=1 Tax=Pedobacter sp. L105 TaxID=1641871 RepID=UPI002110D165|nr:GLPGLI family protein [Pedobacter sp. L105]